MRYINVIGTSASGKSTFAKALAAKLQLDYIELDDLFWLDDWQQRNVDDFKRQLQQHTQAAPQGYVIDGNYSQLESIKWQHIDCIIWLDLPFWRNFKQAITRAVQRASSQQSLWPHSNNRETWAKLLSKESIIWWMMKTHQENRRRYLSLMQQPHGIEFIRLCSRQQMQLFLSKLHL